MTIRQSYPHASGTALAGDVRSTATFSTTTLQGVNGSLASVAGGNTITPNTGTQTAIAANTIANASISVAGDANLIAGNILSGKTIFGVAGSLVGGTPFASGTATSSAGTSVFLNDAGGGVALQSITVTGLTFTASRIVYLFSAASFGIVDTSDVLVGSNASTHIAYYAGTTTGYRLTSPASITNTGFVLPVNAGSASITWYAYA